MNILLTGIDGYLGWPTALKLAREFPAARIIGVDNLGRRRWVEESGSVSAIPIRSMEERLAAAREHGIANVSFLSGDLTDRDFVTQLVQTYRFDTVLHVAAQPSAPYAQINGDRANYTQWNNNQSLRNLLWAVKETGLAKTCRFVVTTTTGVYGSPAFPIPEGFVQAGNKGASDLVPFGNMAGSWYHMSRVFDVGNLWLANRQWGLGVMDLRTSIVFGAETEETAPDPRLATRFDFDFYFGVVMNRFCAMALTGHPITIYGKGEQKKPMISLEDCAQSCVNAVKADPGGKFNVFNQTTVLVSIADLAYAVRDACAEQGVAVEVTHIPNPRVEDEEHKMEMDTDRFRTLLPSAREDLGQGARRIIVKLAPHVDTLRAYRDRFMNA